MKVLIVTAHADDLECHASGLIVKLAHAGHDIVSIVTTAGQRGQMYETEPALMTRTRESIAAHALLGLSPLHLNRYEREYGVTPETQAEFTAIVEKIKPDLVVTHWPIDVNFDHRVCGILAMTPCVLRGVNTELFFFEPNSSGRASADYRPQSLAFFPTHYVDVSDQGVLDEKRNLIYEHVSQDPDGMWPGQLNSQVNRGQEAGMIQAEAYIRATRCGELPPWLRPFFIPTSFTLPRPVGVDYTPAAIGISL